MVSMHPMQASAVGTQVSMTSFALVHDVVHYRALLCIEKGRMDHEMARPLGELHIAGERSTQGSGSA